MMITVGIHNSGITSACSIIKNGKILYAACEERFTRRKYDKLFPINALNSGLKYLNLDINNVNNFSIAWNPAINLSKKYRSAFSDWPAFSGARLYSAPNKILPLLSSEEYSETILKIQREYSSLDFIFTNHHESHAAFSFYSSGFENSDILINDGYGEESCFTVYTGTRKGLKKLYSQEFPHSIGMLYSTITQFLGFTPNFDEWKVMGASAYGDPKKYLNKFQKLINFNNGKINLDLKYFTFYNFEQSLYYSEELVSLLGLPRVKSEFLSQSHYDLAASLQYITEAMVIKQLKFINKITGNSNVCLSGGVAMNCLLNGKVSKSGIYKNVSIPHSPDDSGNAIGSALLVQSREYKKYFSLDNIRNPYLGIEYDNNYYRNILNKYQINFFLSKNISKDASELIASGNIIGWFHGKMEFGQRALGNRSILADPRIENIKDKINSAIKYRENFRPFAPSILDEEVSNWFDTNTNEYSIFMEKTCFIKKNKQKLIPGVVHIDGSARLQTVTKKNNHNLYYLLNAFFNLTNIPILINTSFNINSEPIVQSPEDAIRTFYTSGLDYLVLGSFIISKK